MEVGIVPLPLNVRTPSPDNVHVRPSPNAPDVCACAIVNAAINKTIVKKIVFFFMRNISLKFKAIHKTDSNYPAREAMEITLKIIPLPINTTRPAIIMGKALFMNAGF
jgi:hypothetical protein